MKAPPLDVEMRPYREGDFPYVASSWSRSFAGGGSDALVPSLDGSRKQQRNLHGYPIFERKVDQQYYDDFRPVMLDLIGRSTIRVWHLPQSEEALVAWAAVEDDVLHYLLVKPRWRELGVGQWIVDQLAHLPITSVSHWTSWAGYLHLPQSWEFRRFRIWRTKP